ncbi:Mur ligase domain-containing protein, partial [Prochlorococcus sp. AH-736-M13]
MDKELLLKSHFHFIGIGGIGMSALAMGLLKKGCSVSGSDLVKNDETNKLEKLGAVIFTSQVRQNIEFIISKFTSKLINFVVSSAIKPENE